jgi:3-dehydroquinate synthase
VDSSIGGKLGVDFEHFKNHVGVFQLPALTLLYDGFLNTLPKNELRSGFAEVIKHILISDHALWQEIKSLPFEKQDWKKLIAHSVSFKSAVVTEDPKERGLRKVLNAGHTIGHAIESYLLDTGRKVMHGEAIAAGLIAEGFIARNRGLLSEKDLTEIREFVTGLFGRIILTSDDEQRISELTLQDKKNKGNKILCVLLDGIGKAKWDCEISTEEVRKALTFYRSV